MDRPVLAWDQHSAVGSGELGGRGGPLRPRRRLPMGHRHQPKPALDHLLLEAARALNSHLLTLFIFVSLSTDLMMIERECLCLCPRLTFGSPRRRHPERSIYPPRFPFYSRLMLYIFMINI